MTARARNRLIMVVHITCRDVGNRADAAADHYGARYCLLSARNVPIRTLRGYRMSPS